MLLVLIFGSLIAGEAVQLRPFTGMNAAANPLDFALAAATAALAVRLAVVREWGAFAGFVRHHAVWKWSALFLGWAAATLLLNAAAYESREIAIAAAYLARLAAAFFLAWAVSFEADRFRLPAHEWFTATAVALLGFGFLILARFPHFGFMRSEGWDPHIGRLLSTFYDPNLFGVFAVLTMAFALAKYCSRPDRIVARAYLLLFAVSWAALYLTYSRSAWLAGLVAIPAIAWKRRRLAAFAAAVVFAAALLIPTRLADRFETAPSLADTSRYSSEGFACDERTDRECDPTGSTRIASVRKGFELAREHPIIGVGYNAYGFALADRERVDGKTLRRNSGHGSDNSFLNVWATTGIVGVGIFLVFCFQLLRVLLRAGRGAGENAWLTTALFWFTVALLAAAFFNNVLLYPFLLVPWLLLVAVTLPTGRAAR